MLHTDSAVAGGAAGLGLGLLGCGSNDGKTGEMLAYAHDTQHEKITRGLAILAGPTFGPASCSKEGRQ